MKSVAAKLARYIADAIAADATIKAWVLAQFGANAVLTVQSAGMAARTINETQCPAVIVSPEASRYSIPYEPNDSTVNIRIRFGVSSTTSTDSTAQSVRRIVFDNVELLEDFSSLLVTCANTACGHAGGTFAEVDLTEESGFPMAVGSVLMSFLVVGYEDQSATVTTTTTTTT